MKSILSFIIFTVLITNQLFATEQESDIMYYDGEKLTVDVGWGHPSPLETYFRQNGIQYPFQMLSTANYRGHIATWKVENKKFYITEVAIEDKKFKPSKFQIQSKQSSLSTKNKVFADWFSGVLVCQKRKKKDYWKVEYTLYCHVKNGEIQKVEKITDKDFKRIQNFTEKDSTDLELQSKLSILYLNQSYISYYFRLYDDEEINIENKEGYINGKYGHSIILEYFDNDHMKWIYNWENQNLNGAPNGVWEVKNNRLYLNSINLHTGTGFYKTEKTKIDLINLFPNNKITNGSVFVDWANGIYLVSHGKKVKDEFNFEQFKATEYTLLRINNGIINESRTIPNDFNFRKMPEDTDEELKKLIEDYKKQ